MTDRQNPTTAVVYARVSSDRQDVDLSVAAQLRALREYAERNGFIIVPTPSAGWLTQRAGLVSVASG